MKSIDSVRSEFPSLLNKDDKGNQVLYLDGPGGTQVPTSVIIVFQIITKSVTQILMENFFQVKKQMMLWRV